MRSLNEMFSMEEVDLMAAYEKAFDVPQAERITDWWGDLAVYEFKLNVKPEQAEERLKKSLAAINMSREEYAKNQYATQKALAEKMLENTNPKFEWVVIFDKPVLFTCERLNRNLPIDGVYYYDIRHDDECRGDMAQLKDRVMVNHWATVISKERFEPREVGGKIFTTAEGVDMDEGDYNYLGETLSVSEYLEKYDELVREYCEPKAENNLEMGM